MPLLIAVDAKLSVMSPLKFEMVGCLQSCTLHWDSKLTECLGSHCSTEERLSVRVGDASQMKLLGVPGYKKVTGQMIGDIVADITMKLLTD